MTDTKARNRMREIVDWKLEHEVDSTRRAIVERARWLGEDLLRLADGLEADSNYLFNTLGVLQGNGVELDGMCMKLGLARETLKMFRQAMPADDAQETTE